jgi:hypothetical protein
MTRRYFHDEVGWNSRMDAIQAAVLEVKLRYVDEGNQQRRDRAARYDELFRAAGLAAASESASTKDGSSFRTRIPAPPMCFTSTSSAPRGATLYAKPLPLAASAAKSTTPSRSTCRPR